MMSFPNAVSFPGARNALVAAMVAIFVLSGCTPVIHTHGYVPTEETLAALKVGVDDKETVVQSVGRPLYAGMAQESGWYYVASTVQRFAYRYPEVLDRELVVISFDTSGIITNIERFGLEDGRVIALNRRVTAVAVESPGIIRQILGNIGTITAGDVIDDR